MSVATQQVAVGASAVKVSLDGYTLNRLTNVGPNEVYLGPDNTVTDTTGFAYVNGDPALDFITSSSGEVWAICSAAESATVTVWAQT